MNIRLKITTLWVALLLSGTLLAAQAIPEPTSINIGYWGHFATQPGIKMGAEFSVLNWAAGEFENKGTKLRSLYVGPQVGFYTRSKNHSNLYIGMESGVRLQKKGKRGFSTYGLGLGYLGRSQILTFTHSLGDGSLVATEREWRSNFLPTLNYAYGLKINPRLSGFAKASAGTLLGPGREPSAMLFLEIGIKFNLQPSPVMPN